MLCTPTPPYAVQPLEKSLAGIAEPGHAPLRAVYAAMEANPTPGLTAKAALQILNCSESYLRKLAKSDAIPWWVDGPFKRYLKDAVYGQVIRTIIETYAIGAPPKKARTPKPHFPKGYHRSRQRTPQELDALRKANEARHQAKLARNSSSEAGAS
jgi:hypothetical protein